MNVLIVEDDPEFAVVVKTMVETRGHSAEVCTRGKHAPGRFLNGLFDLVLLEARLPDMDGDRLIRRIKEIRPDALIVAMADHNSPAMETRIRGQGVLYYMIKTLEIENLFPLLDHVSERATERNRELPPARTPERRPDIRRPNRREGGVEGEKAAMEDAGICTACEEFDVCVLRRRNRKPVLFCEEFQLPAPPSKRVEIGIRLWDSGERQSATVSEQAERGRSSYAGLCRTCRRLPTCRFSKPGGGTWLCPNYEEDGSTGLKQ